MIIIIIIGGVSVDVVGETGADDVASAGDEVRAELRGASLQCHTIP